MGALLSLPLAGSIGSVATSALAGCAFCFGSNAASLAFKSCNCNSSIATRVGFALIFSLNSMFAWLMRTDWAVRQIEKISLDYLKVDCSGGKCYGVLAVHRICFALALLHLILGALLIGVKDTKNKRAAIQNGWWGPKVLAWIVLVIISFVIPNGFFIFWGNWVSLLGATIFILIGLVLLVDFAHSWTEQCLENWENSESNLWQWILVGSTALMYAATVALTGVMYGFFANQACTLNRFFITFNWILCVLITFLCVHPAIQEANPKSGLAQASMVSVYCTYLIMSAVGNYTKEEGGGVCNPLRNGTRTTTVIIGGCFTFIAIAYSTTRAATQSRALVGNNKRSGAIALDEDNEAGHHNLVTTQPSKVDNPRYQGVLAAVEAGAIPASALQEFEEDEEEVIVGEERDDERTGTRYNYAWFHVIFAMAAMYVGMLLTDWQILRTSDPTNGNSSHDLYIGKSKVAMWMRVISSWLSFILYSWSLIAPIAMPDRFGDWD